MMGFIRKIKELYTISKRLTCIESELNELDARLEKAVLEHSKVFEKKIQEMTFAYTRNLDDTKSDYLKRYLEVRMNCLSDQVNNVLPSISVLNKDIQRIEQLIEEPKE